MVYLIIADIIIFILIIPLFCYVRSRLKQEEKQPYLRVGKELRYISLSLYPFLAHLSSAQDELL